MELSEQGRQGLIDLLLEAQWIQKARASMKRRGTEGAFTRSAHRAGYDDVQAYARDVLSGKVKGNKKRANFALNMGKINRKKRK